MRRGGATRSLTVMAGTGVGAVDQILVGAGGEAWTAAPTGAARLLGQDRTGSESTVPAPAPVDPHQVVQSLTEGWSHHPGGRHRQIGGPAPLHGLPDVVPTLWGVGTSLWKPPAAARRVDELSRLTVAAELGAEGLLGCADGLDVGDGGDRAALVPRAKHGEDHGGRESLKNPTVRFA